MPPLIMPMQYLSYDGTYNIRYIKWVDCNAILWNWDINRWDQGCNLSIAVLCLHVCVCVCVCVCGGGGGAVVTWSGALTVMQCLNNTMVVM